ncbi:MAG: 6-carboxytetrahydropterin synthase, partial [Candidatus Dadabacteria bacterium]
MEHVTVTKTYRFSAGHRLAIKGLTDEENFRIFDTCSNPGGHGHDYYLEVKAAGGIDAVSGFAVPESVLDEAVMPVIEELDYKRLDIEVQYFSGNQPTGENIAEYIWKRLRAGLGKSLVHIRLSETATSYFE